MQVGDRYWCKTVDARDRSTWMTPATVGIG
jgi:hypothetical protein